MKQFTILHSPLSIHGEAVCGGSESLRDSNEKCTVDNGKLLVEPKISVIVPVYNAGKYLERCLNSILGQTFTDFELILVEDCSTDNSLSICEAYAKKDPRVTLIRNEKNEGINLAHKTGLSSASGEFTYFCDDDDWIESDMFEQMYAAALSGGYDLVFSDCYMHVSPGVESYISEQDPTGYSKYELMVEVIAQRKFSGYANKLIKTSVCKMMEFPPISYGSDHVKAVQAIHFSKKIGYVNKAFWHWCYNPLSTSRAPERMFKSLIDAYKCYMFLLVFLIDNEISYDESLKEMMVVLTTWEAHFYYNKKIFAEFKKSFDRIIGMKKQNAFTKEALEAEQKAVEQRIIELNKANVAGKLVFGAWRGIKSLFPHSLQKIAEKAFARIAGLKR
jgi:glycosyltransferase involved in cell wall biosynthesis